jgi:hypothetical protein
MPAKLLQLFRRKTSSFKKCKQGLQRAGPSEACEPMRRLEMRRFFGTDMPVRTWRPCWNEAIEWRWRGVFYNIQLALTVA